MFENFVKRYVSVKLIPRRRRTEWLLKHFCEKSTGKTFEKWVELGNKSEREVKIYFDVADEMFGARLFADETFALAIAEAYVGLVEWISQSDYSFTPNTVSYSIYRLKIAHSKGNDLIGTPWVR